MGPYLHPHSPLGVSPPVPTRHLIPGIALLILVAIAGCGSGGIIPSQPTSATSPAPPTSLATQPSPIQHVVIIMQENRSFDNLFNGFPGADTVLSGMSKNQVVPLRPVTLSDGRDVDHSHISWWLDWNHGKMDGFAHEGGPNPLLPYSYVPSADTLPYWNLAQQYTLGDRMFQSNTGPSFVAHQYMIAGQSGEASENPAGNIWGCDATKATRVALVGPNGTDLPGVYPCFDYPTMAESLDARGITWRYYAPGSKDNFFIISAFQAIRSVRFGKDWKNNVISPETQVLTDIAKGKLASVTWIVPSFDHSDHPGAPAEGPDWVASITNAIGTSNYWNSTVIFISWDDWGGWYDHVSPPRSITWASASASPSSSSPPTPAKATSPIKSTRPAASSPTSNKPSASPPSAPATSSPTTSTTASTTPNPSSPTAKSTPSAHPSNSSTTHAPAPPTMTKADD